MKEIATPTIAERLVTKEKKNASILEQARARYDHKYLLATHGNFCS